LRPQYFPHMAHENQKWIIDMPTDTHSKVSSKVFITTTISR